MCKVSVLVPVYNVKKYLRQCLASLASQTLDDIEFVCIDDGSTDGCSEILDEYAERDGRFRVIHKENSGYGASMNVGLRAAKGEYIGIVESDDFADAGMFSELYETAMNQNADVVRSNFWWTTRAESKFYEALFGHPYRQVFCPMKQDPKLLLALPNIWSAIYRKAFLFEHDIWFHETPGASYQDLSFSFMVISSAQRYFLVKDAYLRYRVDNPGSSVHSKGKVFCVSNEYDYMEAFLRKHERGMLQHRWAARMFFLHIMANESRIASEYLGQYWKRAIGQLMRAHQDGYFEHELIYHPHKWIMQRLSRQQQRALTAIGWWMRLKSAPHVYLYGAGKVAKGILEIMESHGTVPSGIIVSQRKGNPAELHRIPVYTMQSAPIDREHDAVVMAVTPRKPEVQQEIFFTLEEAGYQNVIVLTEELRQARAGV